MDGRKERKKEKLQRKKGVKVVMKEWKKRKRRIEKGKERVNRYIRAEAPSLKGGCGGDALLWTAPG